MGELVLQEMDDVEVEIMDLLNGFKFRYIGHGVLAMISYIQTSCRCRHCVSFLLMISVRYRFD